MKIEKNFKIKNKSIIKSLIIFLFPCSLFTIKVKIKKRNFWIPFTRVVKKSYDM